MKLGKFLKKLDEEFFTSVKREGKVYEVFKCTGSKGFSSEDLKALKEMGIIRFRLDYDKDELLAWDGNFLHSFMAQKLGLPYGGEVDYDDISIWGEAEWDGSGLKYNGSYYPLDMIQSFISKPFTATGVMRQIEYLKKLDKRPKVMSVVKGLDKELTDTMNFLKAKAKKLMLDWK